MSRRVKLNDEDLATEAGAGLLRLLEEITADGAITKDEVRALGAWLESAAANSTVPGLHCLREEVAGILADNRISEPELRVLRGAVLRVLPAKARKEADARFYAARQRDTIARERARGYDRTLPQPATEAQIAYIRDLGGTILEGLDTGAASMLIMKLLETRPTARQRMVLRFWNRLDLMTAGVDGVSLWMDQWYAQDPDHLEAWKLWKREVGDAGHRGGEFVNEVPVGAGREYLARVKAAAAPHAAPRRRFWFWG